MKEIEEKHYIVILILSFVLVLIFVFSTKRSLEPFGESLRISFVLSFLLYPVLILFAGMAIFAKSRFDYQVWLNIKHPVLICTSIIGFEVLVFGAVLWAVHPDVIAGY